MWFPWKWLIRTVEAEIDERVNPAEVGEGIGPFEGPFESDILPLGGVGTSRFGLGGRRSNRLERDEIVQLRGRSQTVARKDRAEAIHLIVKGEVVEHDGFGE